MRGHPGSKNLPALVFLIDHRGRKLELTLIQQACDLPEADRRFLGAVLEWFHSQGLSQEISCDDLLRRSPTVILHLGGFTLSIRLGGGAHLDEVSLTVYGPTGQVVDDRMFCLPKAGEVVPERSPYGAILVNGRKPMDFVPLDPASPKFIPPQPEESA